MILIPHKTVSDESMPMAVVVFPTAKHEDACEELLPVPRVFTTDNQGAVHGEVNDNRQAPLDFCCRDFSREQGHGEPSNKSPEPGLERDTCLGSQCKSCLVPLHLARGPLSQNLWGHSPHLRVNVSCSAGAHVCGHCQDPKSTTSRMDGKGQSMPQSHLSV